VKRGEKKSGGSIVSIIRFKSVFSYMSKQLRDSAFRLISKITEDMENKRFKKAFEDLDKAEKIAKKIKNPDVSYHTFFFERVC
jgi:hypothetical protein